MLSANIEDNMVKQKRRNRKSKAEKQKIAEMIAILHENRVPPILGAETLGLTLRMYNEILLQLYAENRVTYCVQPGSALKVTDSMTWAKAKFPNAQYLILTEREDCIEIRPYGEEQKMVYMKMINE